MTHEEEIEINYLKQPTVFDKLLEPVHDFVEKQAQQLPQSRRQTYPYLMFFRTLICYLVSGTPSLKLFLNTLLNKGLLPDALKLTPFGRTTPLDRRTPSSHGNMSGTQAWACHPGSHHGIWPRQPRRQ
jgi:hypothetical protein